MTAADLGTLWQKWDRACKTGHRFRPAQNEEATKKLYGAAERYCKENDINWLMFMSYVVELRREGCRPAEAIRRAT